MYSRTADMTRLRRKHRDLAGLAEFYSRLYADWDAFVTQYCDPSDHAPPSFSSTGSRRPRQGGSGYQHSAHGTAGSEVTGAWSNQPVVVREGECASADIGTTSPRFKAVLSSSQFGGMEHTSEVSAAEDVTLTTSRKSSGRRLANRFVDESNEAEDIKPVIGSMKSGRTGARAKRARPSGEIGAKNSVEVAGEIARAGLEGEVEDIKPVIGSMKSGRTGTRAKRARPSGEIGTKNRVEVVGEIALTGLEGEVEDIKPVIGSMKSGRTGTRAKRARPSGEICTKNSVEVAREIARAGLEEEDVKPDLASLNVKPDCGLTEKGRRGGSRTDCEDIKPAVRKSRRNRRRKRSRRSKTGRKERSGEMAGMGLEDEDVKPDVSLLAERKVRRRSRRVWSLSPGVLTRAMYRARLLLLNTACCRRSPAASCYASPASRRPQSPPFRLLSPSQIKIEP